MTLIYQAALLSGSALTSKIDGASNATPDNPIICYAQKATAATADSSQSGFPVSNALINSTAELWKSNSTGVQNIDFDMTGKGAVTSFCVGAHNLAGAYVRLRSATTQGGTYSDVIPSTYVETNAPLMFCFVDPDNDFFRLEITPFADKPIIGLIYVGEYFQLQRRIYTGHSPLPYSLDDDYYTGMSEDGNFLGRVLKSTKLTGSIKQENVTPAHFRSYVWPMLLSMRTKPFFFAWRPESYPQETALCWTDGSVTPSNALSNGMMEYQIKMMAHNPLALSAFLEEYIPSSASQEDYGLDLSGTTKYFPAAYASNGKIYAPPYFDDEALIIDTINGEAVKTNFGLSFSGSGIYGFAILAPNGKIYCIPDSATNVLIIDTSDDTAITTNFGLSLSGSSKYAHAILAPNGKIYCIPFNATQCLVIDTSDDSGVLTNFGLTLPGGSSYNGAVLASNGKIYSVPHSAQHSLIINTNDDTAVLNDFGLTLSDSNKWRKGVLAANGKIYCSPSNANDCLIIDTSDDSAVRDNLGVTLSGTAKYFDAYLGKNGKVYFANSGISQVLIVDPSDDSGTLTNFGLSLTSGYFSAVLHTNGKLYLNPNGPSTGFLVIDTNSEIETAEFNDFGLDMASASSINILLGHLNRLFTIPYNDQHVVVVSP